MLEEAAMDNTICFNKSYVGRPYSEYMLPVDFTILFRNNEKGICKQIIDRRGNIEEFPGVEDSPRLAEELGDRRLEPVVKYEARFKKLDDDRWIMVWTVRPDGSYWMDSWGFGAEDYEAISLYSHIDAEGNFMMPFRLYEIGSERFGDEISCVPHCI